MTMVILTFLVQMIDQKTYYIRLFVMHLLNTLYRCFTQNYEYFTILM